MQQQIYDLDELEEIQRYKKFLKDCSKIKHESVLSVKFWIIWSFFFILSLINVILEIIGKV